MVNISLTLFQYSPGNEMERLLTVMKSRSPKVHLRRMHFRRSSRLSALAVRKRGRGAKKGNAVLITVDGEMAYWNSIPGEIISSRGSSRLFACGLS